eukprot:s105_g7.t1
MPRFETSPLDAGLFCLRKSAKRWAQAIISARFIRFLLMQSDVLLLVFHKNGSSVIQIYGALDERSYDSYGSRACCLEKIALGPQSNSQIQSKT